MQTLIDQAQITIVEPSGHLNAANAAEFQSHLAKAVSQNNNAAILVDMGKVQSLDTAGLMALVSGLSLAQRLQRRFSLCCVSPTIRIIFELTQLDRVFEIFDNHAAFKVEIS